MLSDRPTECWFQPSNTPLVPAVKARKPVLVLFVGLPAVGKTTLYRKHFKPSGYVHVSNLRTSDDMTAIEEARAKGKSVVVGQSTVITCEGETNLAYIDKINGTKCVRKDYIDCAKRLKMSVQYVSIRSSPNVADLTDSCIWFADTEVAWHNSFYRAVGRTDALRELEVGLQPFRYSSLILTPYQGEATLIPRKVFTDHQRCFEEPTRAEGFNDLKRVHFRFEGTEEDRNRYMLWYPPP